MAATNENQRSIPVWLPVLAVVLLAARIISANLHLARDTSLVSWVDADDAMQTASTTGRPILYDFTAEWCVPCQHMDEQVYQDAVMAKKINDHFVPVRIVDREREEGINTTEVEELKRRYEVTAFPTIVITDAAGNVLQRAEGFRGRQSFEQMLERFR